VYTAITPPCIRRAREIYTAVTRPCTGRERPSRRHVVYTCTRPCNVSCARYTAVVYTAPVNTSSPSKKACTRPYNGRAVYTARTRPCMGRAHGPSAPPVYMTVYGPSARTSSAVYVARTRPRTRDVYTAVHTAVCTTRIRPRTRVYVSTCTRAVYTAVLHGRERAIYTSENGRLHGRTRPCNVSCIRPCTGRIGSCTRQCTGCVHGRFRPCALAVYTAVFGRLHSAYTAV